MPLELPGDWLGAPISPLPISSPSITLGFPKNTSFGDSPWPKKTPQRRWTMGPSPKAKAPKSALAESLKADLDVRARKLVQDVLKPRYVAPPPEDL